MNYFLYCRKSTDIEDKQVLSIEAQLSELRDFATRENLAIAETFIEKQSANQVLVSELSIARRWAIFRIQMCIWI